MQYARLGDTGLVVSRLSLGTMTFGSGKAGKYTALSTIDQKQANELVARALDAGINSFNSAATYSGGESEEYLGRALGSRRADAVITTKVGFRSNDAVTDGGLSHRSIMKTADDCLKRLGTDWIDVFSVHRVDEYTPIEEVVEGLDRLVQQGKVRYVGYANWPAWMVGKAVGLQQGRNLARFRVGEMLYTLISRDIEQTVVPLMKESGIGLFVWSPLAGGLLSGKYTNENREGDGGRMSRTYGLPFDWDLAFKVVEITGEIASRLGATPAQVALAWLLSRSAVTSILIGVSSATQLEDNLGAVSLPLTEGDLGRLDDVTKLPPRYPEWFVDRNSDPVVRNALAG